MLPPQFAFRAYTSRLIAAGITTVFHGVGFRSRSAIGAARPVGLTETMLQLLSEPSDPRIDHRMLARLDVLDEQAWRNLHEAIARRRNSTPILLSLEDHTPGRGQYRDLAHLERRLRLDEGLSRDEANVRVASLLERGGLRPAWWCTNRGERVAADVATVTA